MNAITNEVLKCIRERRSTRKFTGQQITPEQRDALLEAAIWAPSGSNSQSWLFTVIQNQDVLLKLNGLVRSAFQTWIPDDDYPAKQKMKERAKDEAYNFFYNAPVLIIASNRSNYDNAMADCSLALENIFIAARSMGLGSCYINQLRWLRDEPKIRDYLFELGVPKEHTICSSAAVGFAGTEPPAPARRDGTINIVS